MLSAFRCQSLRHAMHSSWSPSSPMRPMTAGALLAALVAGDAAEDFERADPKESARQVLEVLRSMFAPKGVNIPAPLQVPLIDPATSHLTTSPLVPAVNNIVLRLVHRKVILQHIALATLVERIRGD